MFWNAAVSEGVKLIAQQMVENPHDWRQGAYQFQNVTNKDLNIWTANGVSFIRMEGGDVFTYAEKRYLVNAIKKSIAMRLMTPNVEITGSALLRSPGLIDGL